MNKAHLHHHTLLYSLNTVTCSLTLSLYTKRLWRMSWQHTSTWSWERWSSQLNTSWLRTIGTMSGERLENVIVYLSLSKAALVQHLSKATFLRPCRQLMDDDENAGWLNFISSVRSTHSTTVHAWTRNESFNYELIVEYYFLSLNCLIPCKIER